MLDSRLAPAVRFPLRLHRPERALGRSGGNAVDVSGKAVRKGAVRRRATEGSWAVVDEDDVPALPDKVAINGGTGCRVVVLHAPLSLIVVLLSFSGFLSLAFLAF